LSQKENSITKPLYGSYFAQNTHQKWQRELISYIGLNNGTFGELLVKETLNPKNALDHTKNV
jgi:hypothetical protein